MAIQYAGSEAFHKASLIETPQGDYKTKKQNQTFFAVKRYISNALLDDEKQKCISLFLGDFLPPSSCYTIPSSSSRLSIPLSSTLTSSSIPVARYSSLLLPKSEKHLWTFDMKELAEKVKRWGLRKKKKGGGRKNDEKRGEEEKINNEGEEEEGGERDKEVIEGGGAGREGEEEEERRKRRVRNEGEDGREEESGRKDEGGESRRGRKERKKVEDLGNKLDKKWVWKIDLKIEKEGEEEKKEKEIEEKVDETEVHINDKVDKLEQNIYEKYFDEEKKVNFLKDHWNLIFV